MKNRAFRLILFLSVLLSLYSCTAHKSIPYLTNMGNESIENKQNSETRITINDQLTIVVNSTTPEATVAFNLNVTPTQLNGATLTMGQSLQTYLVNSNGMINFPIIGEIKVADLTKEELESLIKSRIYPQYLKEEPIITIRITNFRVSVLGEVNRPGNFPVSNERINIFEALALAGDLTLYGKRNNILLVREGEKGKTETVRLNLQDKDILQSPYFYLKQNDVIYVQPNKPKGNASAISSAETLSVSITSVLISLTSLLVTVLK